ncbi:hypothetical protein Tco_1196275, partial [Tanacetum coccineum]
GDGNPLLFPTKQETENDGKCFPTKRNHSIQTDVVKAQMIWDSAGQESKGRLVAAGGAFSTEFSVAVQVVVNGNRSHIKEQDRSILFGLRGSRQQKFLVLRIFDVKEQQGIDKYRFLSSSIVRVRDKV